MTDEIYRDVTLLNKDGEFLCEAQIEYLIEGVPTAVFHEGDVFLRTRLNTYVQVDVGCVVEVRG